MEFGRRGDIVIELSFELEFDICLKTKENLSLWFEKFLKEITDFSPLPKLNFYISEEYFDFYEKTIQKYKDLYPKTELFLVFSKYRRISKLPKEHQYVVNTSVGKNLNNIIADLCNAGAQSIILQHCSDCTDDNLYDELEIEFDRLIKNPQLCRIFLLPYLEEKEIQNFYQGKNKNRSFLICAQPWLNPIIKANGDLLCCKNFTPGSLRSKSFFDLWNSESSQEIRNKLFEEKHFSNCNKCKYLYKKAFFAVENGFFEYKDQKFTFESELNYIESAPGLALCEETLTEEEMRLIPVVFYNSEQLQYIKKNYELRFVIK